MKNYFMLHAFLVICALYSVFAVTAEVAAIEPAEIVGTWRNQYGGVTEFRSDHTYRCSFADELGRGTWDLKKGALLRFKTNYGYCETDRILSFKKDKMTLETPERREIWIREKRNIRWPKELEG
jgi:hypothetical protein